MKKSVYFKNLDGLRFFCFLSVFFFHSFHTDFTYISTTSVYHLIKYEIFGNGNLGVNFFFVLSGFLITFLLIEEKKINGQINLRKFWIRRALRIWPLFYFCVFFGFIIFPQLKMFFGGSPSETATPFFYMIFINNFDLIEKGLPDASILSVLWSVAIEEQFYFVWPIILYVLPIKRYWIIFCTIIIISLVFRALNDNSMTHEFHTLSCIGDMTVGAFGAWLISQYNSFQLKIENLKSIYIACIYFVFLLIYLLRDEVLYATYELRIIERLFISIIILFIILEQNYSKKSFFKLSKFKHISKLGTIAYGLYCFQFIGILIVTKLTNSLAWNTYLWQVILLDSFLALLSIIIIAKISYKYFETPFLKKKEKFEYITK